MKKMLSEIARPELKAVSIRLEEAIAATPLLDRSDIFILMQDTFAGMSESKRSFSELRADAAAKCKKSSSLTLGSIYSELRRSAKLSEEDSNKLMELECSLIEKYTVPRSCGGRLLAEAKRLRMKTAIVSDLIYPREVIESIIKKCGCGKYDALILPAEKNLRDDKDVMDEILSQLSVFPHQLLHIGGSVEHDVEAAVLNGSRSILLSPSMPLMVKSGRLMGNIEALHVFDLDSPEHFLLRCACGLYALYAFDIPQNKIPQSDFCADRHMLGFIVLGTLSLAEKYAPEVGNTSEILDALKNNKLCREGAEDFSALFESCFGDSLKNFSAKDCELPLNFFVNHSAPADRKLIHNQMSEKAMEDWEKNTSEPELAPIHMRRVKKSALYKLADKMFPPGTKVRNIVDGILVKLHR